MGELNVTNDKDMLPIPASDQRWIGQYDGVLCTFCEIDLPSFARQRHIFHDSTVAFTAKMAAKISSSRFPHVRINTVFEDPPKLYMVVIAGTDFILSSERVPTMECVMLKYQISNKTT
jgi:hypothetical protein